jgi:hypothetical protein
MKGPPQVHPRSVGGRRKLAPHRPTGRWFIRGRSLHSAVMCRPERRGLPPGVVSPKRYPDISRALVSAHGSREPDSRSTSNLPGNLTALHRGRPASKSRKSGSVNRPLPLPRHERSAKMRHQTGAMIADAVRYMSVHSRKQPDSHGHSGTSWPRRQQPARRGIPSSRAISAGGGRCWVRTNVG